MPSFTDYTVVIIMGVFVFASLSWVLSAHKWFRGPVRTVDDSQDAEELKEKDEVTIEEREVSVEKPDSEF